MARRTDQQIADEEARLAELLRGFPMGVGSAELAARYALAYPSFPKVTPAVLLRRLEALEAAGRLRHTGAKRYRRYWPTEEAVPAEEPSPHGDGAEEEVAIPLSVAGEEVRALVRRAPAQKPAVIPYDEAFLLGYQPGVTWYLPAPLRARLHAMGRTPLADRPAGTYARHIFERLLIDLSYNSSRLEGNQYTRIDTQRLLQRNIRAQGKTQKDTQMILNHRKAIELLVDHVDEVGYTRYTFCNLHAALAENLLDNPDDEGRLRRHPVSIRNSPYQPLDIPQKIEELFDRLLTVVAQVPDPFEQAFVLMVHLPYLQPFADVNKRTSRLAANVPLIKANLTPLSFVGASEQRYVEAILGVYEERRIELLRDVFVALYERSCARYQAVRRDMAEPDPIRLAYRQPLHALVQEFVREGRAPVDDAIRQWAVAHTIPAQDIAAFTERACELLEGLHEGAISRYGIRPSQYQAWREARGMSTPDEARPPRTAPA